MALLVFAFFWKAAFTNLIFARGDAFLYFYPYWDYRAQALLSGHLPLWNPYLFMGAPFLANSQAGVLYPLNWPLIFFSAPVAFKISIVLHLFIAASGVYVFARRALQQSIAAALLASALFALGGYLTAQVEHINQLQALAWFPWLLVSSQRSVISGQPSAVSRQPSARLSSLTSRLSPLVSRSTPFAIILALSLLAGHTQSTFISLVGVTLYLFILNLESWNLNLGVWSLGFGIFLALLLSAAQLLPTLELSQNSLRGGGLPLREALSFSLPPRLLGRALLPGYSRSLFSEFIAYPGVIGLTLAALGLRRAPQRIALIALAALGLAFALGAYNPLYVLLANIPPFNLFRVPARWLVLFAFGVALLAGHGLDAIRNLSFRHWSFVIALLLLAPLATGFIPAGETGPLPAPQLIDWMGWLIPLALLALLMRLPPRARAPGTLALALAELLWAAQILPYNHLTTPEAYASIRPAMTQLLVPTSPSASPSASVRSSAPPSVDRYLSISALGFDPGDLAELRGEWEPQLPADAVYDAIVATKNKEVLSPNLPLTWKIFAVDGFDGGILPLRHYADFTTLFTGAPSADGRLRENLTAAPDPRLLALTNARYLITDKVNDAWVDGVFYDLQFTLTLREGESASIAYVPPFTATALALVMDAPSGSAHIAFADLPLTTYPMASSRIHFNQPSAPTSITLTGPLTVRGLSLIDERSGVFQTLTLGPYKLVHSGDVKIYELQTVLPRAFVVPEAVVITDAVAARATLADPAFNMTQTIILAPTANGQPPTANRQPPTASRQQSAITNYQSEFVRLTATGPGYLLLTDAFYPGWTATVDGKAAPILRADLMFRAVALPEGEHTVEFRFAPRSVQIGLWVSGVTWALVLIMLVGTRVSGKW